jgi:hypothetical protein
MKTCPKCGVNHNKNGTHCSRKCSNSRTWTDEDKKKKSIANKKYFQNNPHPTKGKPGWKHSDEMKQLKRQLSLKEWDTRGRRTIQEKALQNKLNVHNYRARKMKATCPTADLKLIKRIMEACPIGYDVDHIVSMSNGGPHHEDNLQYLPSSENRRKSNKDVYDESLVIRWQDVLKEG